MNREQIGALRQNADEALAALANVVDFAYQHGYHEHGYPLVETVRAALDALTAERDSLARDAKQAADNFDMMTEKWGEAMREVDRLTAEHEASARDAERWRIARDGCLLVQSPLAGPDALWTVSLVGGHGQGASPEDAIDAAIEAHCARTDDSVWCNRVLSVEEFKERLRDLIVAYARAIPHPVGSGPEAITHGEAVARAQVRVVEAYAFAARAATREEGTPR